MNVPDESWDEYDWERALRESDQFAARYFRLLRRFCDLPGGNELIARYMGPDFEDRLPDCDYDCENCEHQWDCEFAAATNGTVPEAEPEQCTWEPQFGTEDDEHEDDEETNPDAVGTYAYETDPTFVTLRQGAIGWCNIYAAILPADARPIGLKVLFHIGRSLANLAYSLDEGMYEQPAATIAFAKRSLGHLNQAVGHINKLMVEKPRLKKILLTIRDHLLRANENLIDHLHQCRRDTPPSLEKS